MMPLQTIRATLFSSIFRQFCSCLELFDKHNIRALSLNLKLIYTRCETAWTWTQDWCRGRVHFPQSFGWQHLRLFKCFTSGPFFNCIKSLKIPKDKPEAVNRMTDDTMAKRKKRQKDKTVQRKLKVYPTKTGGTQVLRNDSGSCFTYDTSVVLLINDTNIICYENLVGHRCALINTNNINKTWIPYNTNGSQDQSNIVLIVCRESCTDLFLFSFTKLIVNYLKKMKVKLSYRF